MIVIRDNFESFFENLILGHIRAQNYNSECFGMSDLNFAMQLTHVMGQFIEKVKDAGYCIYSVLDPLMKKYDYFIKDTADPKAKQTVDEEFRIDMSEFVQALSFCEAVAESTKQSIAEGYMELR